MFSFLSRPKPALRSQSSLISYKALFLFVFTSLAFSLLPIAHGKPAPAAGWLFLAMPTANHFPMPPPTATASTR